LEDAHSLKDKRHVVQSLKDRLRHKFNVAVAEIDYQDLWQRAAVAAVTFKLGGPIDSGHHPGAADAQSDENPPAIRDDFEADVG